MPKFHITSKAALAILVHAKNVRMGNVEGDKEAFAELEKELQGFASRLTPFTLEWTPNFGGEAIAQVGWMIQYRQSPGFNGTETVIFNEDTGRAYTLIGDHRAAFKEVAANGWDAIFDAYKLLQPTHGYSFEG